MKTKEEIIKIIRCLLIDGTKNKNINYVFNFLENKGFDYLYAYNETIQNFLIMFEKELDEKSFNPYSQIVFIQSALLFENVFSNLSKIMNLTKWNYEKHLNKKLENVILLNVFYGTENKKRERFNDFQSLIEHSRKNFLIENSKHEMSAIWFLNELRNRAIHPNSDRTKKIHILTINSSSPSLSSFYYQKQKNDFIWGSSFSNFMFRKNVIFVEGNSDKIILEKILSSVRIDFWIFICHGANAPFFIENVKDVYPSQYWDNNCFAIFDADKDGVELKEKTSKILSEDHVFTLDDFLGLNESSCKSIEALYDNEMCDDFCSKMGNLNKRNKKAQDLKVKFADAFVEKYKDNKFDEKITTFRDKIVSSLIK